MSRDVFKNKNERQLTSTFSPKCHLNFGLHNTLGELIVWIINMQSWFVTKNKKWKNNQLSVSMLQFHMFLQMLKMVAKSIA